MLDLKHLKKGGRFYFVHKHCWFYEYSVVRQENDFFICRNVTKDSPCCGRVEPMEQENEEYFLEKEEALAYFHDWQEKKRQELSDPNKLLENLYAFAEIEISECELPLYKEAIETVKNKLCHTCS